MGKDVILVGEEDFESKKGHSEWMWLRPPDDWPRMYTVKDYGYVLTLKVADLHHVGIIYAYHRWGHDGWELTIDGRKSSLSYRNVVHDHLEWIFELDGTKCKLVHKEERKSWGNGPYDWVKIMTLTANRKVVWQKALN